MKFLLALATLLFGLSAFAARYLVTYQGPGTAIFSKIDRMALSSSAGIEIKQSFPHLQALLIESEDENLRSLNPQVWIEKEILHPAPKVLVSPPSQSFAIETANPWGLEAIQARKAWDLSKRGQGSRVLVLDSGADLTHPALSGQVLLSKNLIDQQKPSQSVADKVGHGTHVAGIIAAKEATNGFSGVAPGARLLIGKICTAEGCTSGDLVAGIEWGLSQKVDVINLSIGDDQTSNAEKTAIGRAEKLGVVVVAASGNSGKGQVAFPAAFPSSVAVGAIDPDLQRADFSQWGPELDVMGPGVGIVSSTPVDSGKPYSIYTGTSMAAPHVTGVVALIKAAHKSLKPAQVRQIIKDTATGLSGNSSYYGAGLINAEKAVTKASQIR